MRIFVTLLLVLHVHRRTAYRHTRKPGVSGLQRNATVAMADSASSLYEGDNVLLYSPEKEGFLYAEPSR